ncbi:MAG: 2Fe-2S iron-sulfur cluster-binding protein [Paracoccaceae bacterium]
MRFHDLDPDRPLVPVTLDGQPVDLPDGANLAAALLGAGIDRFRATPVLGAPRGPFCMMGACFDCLIEVDGVIRQACMVQVQAGLVLSRPAGQVGT